MFSAGGRHAWKTHEYKGWVVSLEWVGEGKRAMPAMVIWPQSNVFVTGEGQGLWCIGRRAISEFVGFGPDGTCTGSASLHCYRECHEALPILGKDKNDKSAFLSLVDTVIRFAPDLVLMPATPRWIRKELDTPAMWDVTRTDKNSGKTLQEVEL